MDIRRILVIDDHDMFREGMRMALESSLPNIKVVDCNSLISALDLPVANIELVVLDNKLGQFSGLNGIDSIKRKWPGTHVVVLSAYDDPVTMEMALNRGADGFISKSESRNHIISTIRSRLDNNARPTNGVDMSNKKDLLTKRQQEVLALLQRGLSNKLIAQQLSLSVNTVRRHVQDILLALKVSSRAEAVYHSQKELTDE